MGNRVELCVGFAPSSQSKGFFSTLLRCLSMDENCAWRCDWLDGLSSENDHISTPWCTVSDLVVGILGCLPGVFFICLLWLGVKNMSYMNCLVSCRAQRIISVRKRQESENRFKGISTRQVYIWGEKTITIFPVKNLVGGLEHFLFFHILGMSSSQLTPSFFRGVGSTTNQIIINHH